MLLIMSNYNSGFNIIIIKINFNFKNHITEKVSQAYLSRLNLIYSLNEFIEKYFKLKRLGLNIFKTIIQ